MEVDRRISRKRRKKLGMPAKPTLLAQLCLLCWVCLSCAASAADDGGTDSPHVFVALQTRNSAHLLPNFFGYLENLDYPKKRISVW